MHKDSKTETNNEWATPMDNEANSDLKNTTKDSKSANDNAWVSTNKK